MEISSPFKREIGALLSPQGHVLSLVYGSDGRVEFPGQLTWQLHKERPGIVYAFMHTHPPGMTRLSREDETTLKAWALALYPFSARMGVVTLVANGTAEYPSLSKVLKMYYADLQPKETWIPGTPRRFRILEEDMPRYSSDRFPWADWLWYLSCEEGE